MTGRYEKERKELWLKSLVLICDDLIAEIQALHEYCSNGLNGVHEPYPYTVEDYITNINNRSFKLHKLNKLLKE